MGIIASFISGVLNPGFGYIIGKVFLMFDPTLTIEESREVLKEISWFIFPLSLGILVFGAIGYASMQITAENLTAKLRSLYLNNLLKQEVEFFETERVEWLPGKLQSYFQEINDSAGERFGQIVTAVGAVIGGFAFAFIVNSKFSIACCIYMPPIIFALKKVALFLVGK